MIRAPRDIIFLVDSSDSMDPAAFYGVMLDYVQDLWWYVSDSVAFTYDFMKLTSFTAR